MLEDKEKLVRDLVDTFRDRSHLHESYKQKMKEMIMCALNEFLYFFVQLNDIGIEEYNTSEYIEKWVDKFVEERFRQE